MAIDMNKWINIQFPVAQQDLITELIRNYLVLKYRINHLKEQNFYFRLASESNDRKLENLRETYEAHRNNFNNLTVNQIIELKTEAEQDYDKARKDQKDPRFIKAMRLNHHLSDINTCNSYLSAKTKYGYLHPIDDYEHNEEILKIIFAV